MLGLNDYFGWYPGPSGQIFDRTKLSGYLDAARACYPDKALMVTEFGAEANRDGPVEEKGTWAFQQDWINYQLGVFATKPWLSGAIYWALNEFWVRPGWEGGNPRPTAPIHQKGLVTYDGVKKPAFSDIQRWFTHDAAARVRRARRYRATRRRAGRAGSIVLRVRTGGGPGRRACRARTAGACRTGRRTAAGCHLTVTSWACPRRGRCRRLRSRPRRPGSMWTRCRNAGTSETARRQYQGHEMENSEDH